MFTTDGVDWSASHFGDYENDEVCMCELVVTESDASIKSGNGREPIESYRGFFAALSRVPGDENEQLHLFTVRYEKDNGCTEMSEYKLNLSVSGSNLNHLHMQPIPTLGLNGVFNPQLFVNVESCFSVASMRAGKILDKTWKIQRAYIKNFCKTSMQHAKFSKISKNLTEVVSHLKEFYTKNLKYYRKLPKGNSFF